VPGQHTLWFHRMRHALLVSGRRMEFVRVSGVRLFHIQTYITVTQYKFDLMFYSLMSLCVGCKDSSKELCD
jgi:hypothetical protein